MKLGTVLHISSGSGFSERNLIVVSTADGWKQVNDYNSEYGRAKEVKGLVGDSIDISSMRINGVLHEGTENGMKVNNILQIASLPEGSQLRDVKRDKTYTKEGDKWRSVEGAVDYYHFSPHVDNYIVTLPGCKE